jgi:serine/threonine protein kinase
MNQLKIPPARIGNDNYFQLKITDFGLLASGKDPENWRCINGTPGFIPDEFLEHDGIFYTFDVYGLGMSFLGLELNMAGYEGFHHIDAILFMRKQGDRRKKEKKNNLFQQLTQEDVNNLNDINLVVRMKQLIKSPVYKTSLLNELEKSFPEMKENMERKSPGKYDTIDLIKYLEINVSFYRHIMLAAVKVYFTEYIPKVKVIEEIKSYEEEIEGIKEELLTNPENKEDLNSLKAYWENKILICNRNSELISKLIKIYLLMISAKHKTRPSVNQLKKTITQMSAQYYTQNRDLLDEIEMFEEEMNDQNAFDEDNLNVIEEGVFKKRKENLEHNESLADQQFHEMFTNFVRTRHANVLKNLLI